MRFRAISDRLDSIHVILKSFQAATKLTSNVVFCISETAVQIIADPTYRSGPLLSRCELLKENLFSEYLFSGISPEHNLIYFDVKCDSLSNILHALQNNIKSLKLKLTNGRDGRFLLAITVEYPSIDSSRFIDHNVYISITNRKYWNTFSEQPLEPIELIAETVERLASLAQYAVISAKYMSNDKAYFTIGLCNDNISIKSKFTKLGLTQLGNVVPDSNDAQLYKIRIDIRRLNQVFSAISITKPTSTSCSISHENAISFLFFHELTNFKIILPHFNE